MTVLQLPVDKKTLWRFDHLPAGWFPRMLAAAAGLHALVLVLCMMLPGDGVTVVPVRTLNLRLGSHDGITDEAPGGNSAPSASSLSRPKTANLVAEALEAPVQPYSVPAATPPVTETALSQAQQDVLKALEKNIGEREAKDAEQDKRENRKQDAMAVAGATGNTSEATAAGSGRAPVKYVRGDAGGSVYGDSTAAEAAILSRYEQLISRWIEQYKRYPEEAKKQGITGRGVIRIRINREGKVLFYTIDKSTGSAMLDRALNDMVRAADPVPKVPENYPAARLLEFLIPVEFNVR